MKKFFRILFKSIAAILALVVVTVLALIFFGVTVNLDSMRGGVEVAASSALDRKVTIEGPVELEFSNWTALNISDVTIANVKGGVKPNLLNAGFVRMQIGIFPLLKGEINIADITAKDVTLNLESDATGTPNWVFGKTDKSTATESVPEADEKDQENDEPQKMGETGRIQFTALSHLSLQQIFVNYHDAALDKSLSFLLESMEGTAAEGRPIVLKLNGKVQDKSYEMALNGSSIESLFDKNEDWDFETRGEIFGKQISGEGNMSLRSEHPEIHLALAASDLDVGVILSALGLIDGMQASLGDVGMDITLTGDSLHEVLNKSSMIFVVKDGNWKVTLPNTEASFDINSLNGKIEVKEGNNITMALDGAIEDAPVKLLITGAPLVEYVTNQAEFPLSIKAEILETKLSFDSNIKLPIGSTDMTFALKVSAQRIDRLNRLLKLKLPPIGPVTLESKLDIKPQVFDLSDVNLKVGKSNLNGEFKLDLSQTKPKLDMSLISELIQMDDFRTGSSKKSEQAQTEAGAEEPEAETESVENTEEAPDDGKSLLSYEVLKAFDANINIAAKQVLAGEDKLGAAQLVVKIKDASLQVEPITLAIPGGRFDASVEYAPSLADVTLKIKADVEEFDVGVLIRHLKPGSDMGGRLYLDIDIDSTAPDPASIMANASGHLDFGLVPKNFSSGIIDLWAVNLLSAIMDKSTEKDQAVMNCVVIRTKLEEGVLEEEAIYLDTSNMRIAGKMDINFKTRDLEIKLAPKAKSPEFFSVAIPIQVKGNLDDFGLKIGVLRMVGQVVSFITSPVHVPIRRVFTEDSPEDGVEACTYAWRVTGGEISGDG